MALQEAVGGECAVNPIAGMVNAVTGDGMGGDVLRDSGAGPMSGHYADPKSGFAPTPEAMAAMGLREAIGGSMHGEMAPEHMANMGPEWASELAHANAVEADMAAAWGGVGGAPQLHPGEYGAAVQNNEQMDAAWAAHQAQQGGVAAPPSHAMHAAAGPRQPYAGRPMYMGPQMGPQGGWSQEMLMRAQHHQQQQLQQQQMLAQQQQAQGQPQTQTAGPATAEDKTELRSMTRSVVDNVHDDKMQNSQLFQFLRGISDGSINIEGEQLVGGTEQDKAEAAAQAAAERQREAALAQQHAPPPTTAATAGPQVAPAAARGPVATPIQPVHKDAGAATANLRDAEEDYSLLEPGGAYEFSSEDNPYLGMPDALERGDELLLQGHISESVLAFEAEVRANPDNAEGWRMLGLACQEADKDYYAINALETALALDPRDAQAMMALAVSYTNELNKEKALDVLEAWLTGHPHYSHLEPSAEAQIPNMDDLVDDGSFYAQYQRVWAQTAARHTAVTDIYLQAARMNAEDMDADIQIGLGILYNLSREFDKAAACFSAALQVNPDDYLLWNKLGATLANSAQSEKAIGAYYKSLEINPSYVRAKVNVGISYNNLGRFDEAARQFLGALTLQAGARAPHLWHLLRMAFSKMNRRDLVDKTAASDVELFRDEFQF